MAIRLDHLMWGAPSLETGVAEAERLFGIVPVPGGVHPGLGTRNALLSLGESAYLEIIAPDPDQPLAGTFGERLATLERPGLITWAAGARGLADLAGRAASLELTVRGPAETQRHSPDGALLRWELLFLGGHPFPGLMPFFIDWLDTPNPASTSPNGGAFRALDIRTPDAAALNRLFAGLGLEARAVEGTSVEFSAQVDTARGPVTLNSAPGANGWTL